MKIRGQQVYEHKERLYRLCTIKENGCHEWDGSVRNGYGRLVIGSRALKTRKSVSAHRLSYETFIGAIPKGLYVCHKCDNRRCINPEHLWIGTHRDNINDREAKGRNDTSKIALLKGEAHPRAKLSLKQVNEIIALYKQGFSRSLLSRKYFVSYWCIRDILDGRCWKSLPPTQEKAK